MQMLNLDLSILIVSFNNEKLLLDCIKSIYEQKTELSYEIIVVDNNSQDDTIIKLTKLYPEIKLIQNKVNYGFAKANNQGITIAKGRNILLLNNDTKIKENPLDVMVEYLDNNADVGVVGCKIYQSNGYIEPSTHGFPSLLKEFVHLSPLIKKVIPNNDFTKKLFSGLGGKNLMSYWGYNKYKNVDHVTGACFMIKRHVIEEVGLLDEEFFMYHEEVEWCYRIKNKGYRIVFVPVGSIIHFGTKCSTSVKGRLLYERYKGMIYFFKKHYGKYQVYLLRVIYFQGFVLKLLKSIFNKDINRNTYWEILQLVIKS